MDGKPDWFVGLFAAPWLTLIRQDTIKLIQKKGKSWKNHEHVKVKYRETCFLETNRNKIIWNKDKTIWQLRTNPWLDALKHLDILSPISFTNHYHCLSVFPIPIQQFHYVMKYSIIFSLSSIHPTKKNDSFLNDHLSAWKFRILLAHLSNLFVFSVSQCNVCCRTELLVMCKCVNTVSLLW